MGSEQSDKKPVQIQLDHHVALYLYDYLSKYCESREINLPTTDPASFLALSKVTGALESQLLEILSPEYINNVAEAKARILEGYEPF